MTRSKSKWTPLTVRYSRYFWLYRLTPAGRVLFWAVLLTSAGAVTVQIPVYQLFFPLLSLYAAVSVTNFILRPKLEVMGSMPARGTAGEEIRGEFTLTNRGRWTAYDLMLWMTGLPQSLRLLSADVALDRLGTGESGKLPLILKPLKRGVYELPELRPHSTFPFNLMRGGAARVPMGTLTVLPSFHPIEQLDVPVSLRYQPGGVALSSNVGESPEYIGNREYVPGMPARRLDFRSWARLGRPVVREYQEEYYCRVALVLDTWISNRRSPPDGFPQLEAAISLAAAMADALSATEYLIDLFAAGPELYVFRAGRQIAHFDNVLEILAAVDRCRDDPFTTIAPAVSDELDSVSTAICIFLDWDHSREQMVRTIRDAGCELKIVIVRDQSLSLRLPDDLAIEQLTPERIMAGGFDRL